jgi:hypothetical protein
VVFEEFYDNRKNHIEDKNLAADPRFKAQVDEHRRTLLGGWKKALPPDVKNRSDLPKGNDAWYYLTPKQRQSAQTAGTVRSLGE